MKHLKLYENFSSDTNKVIFLDIDGVLNLIYKDSSFDEYGQIFNKTCVDNFKSIIEQTNAKIIVSSTWKDSGLSIMKEMWINRNLPGEVIDITPSAQDVVDHGIEPYMDLVSRGSEIELWMIKNDFKGNYIIIDDVRDFTIEQSKYLIKTNSMIGLTKEDSVKSINLLNR